MPDQNIFLSEGSAYAGTKALAKWSIVGVFAVQGWRLYDAVKGKASKGAAGQTRAVKIGFATFALSLVIGLLADLNPQLGGLFGLAIVIGLLPGGKGSVAGLFTGAANKVSGGGGVGPYKGPH